MSVDERSTEPAAAFGRRTVLALVIGGAALFVALLWMIGAGLTGGDTDDGRAHAGSHGLAGYAGFARYLEQRGFTVTQSQGKAALRGRALLVLTPPPELDGKAIDGIVAARRFIGPTLVLTPKWLTVPIPRDTPGTHKGWIALGGIAPAQWRGFLDEVTLDIAPLAGGAWHGGGLSGRLPAPHHVLSARGSDLVPLAVGSDDRILAAYVADRGSYPALSALAGIAGPAAAQDGQDESARLYPVVFVAEPDLIDNLGMRASPAGVLLVERIIRAEQGEAGSGGDASRTPGSVVFDLTLNGFVRSPNLLTLAFTPPFLAATLCLLLAAIAAGWRTFARFGPPLRQGREIAFGKRALVANAAGLIGRSRRLHLLGPPYVSATRERLVRALGLPRTADADETDAAIDRAQARHRTAGDAAARFSTLVARLVLARGSARRTATARRKDLLAAAGALHDLERTLTR